MESHKEQLDSLRRRMSLTNEKILDALNEFFAISNQIGDVKDKMKMAYYDPVRESEMIKEVEAKNKGPLSQDKMKRIFRQIFAASIEEMIMGEQKRLKINRLPTSENSVIEVRGVSIGSGTPVIIAGPCSVESYDQLRDTAQRLNQLGIKLLRGGAFKPRTSPYSFQGLEEEGLKLLRAVADEFDMGVVTEVLSDRDVELVMNYADVIQVGTRNMLNYSLLKELGKVRKPILLKRGFMATIDEFILAAEYIYLGGNTEIILCERGIRTFETQTRNTLDISCVPILKKETTLPVIVDVSHSLGRKDIIKPIARAALAAGADGLMFETHCDPASALSDADQQLDLEETRDLIEYLCLHFAIQRPQAGQQRK